MTPTDASDVIYESIDPELVALKQQWGPGPWITEPDRIEWRVAGLQCLALRHPRHGSWCGYVGVPRSHPLHGYSYADIEEEIDVHGGVTYADQSEAPIAVAHDPRLWWFGFDCGHFDDFAPGFEHSLLPFRRQLAARDFITGTGFSPTRHGHYRDAAFIKAQTSGLATQLAAITTRTLPKTPNTGLSAMAYSSQYSSYELPYVSPLTARKQRLTRIAINRALRKYPTTSGSLRELHPIMLRRRQRIRDFVKRFGLFDIGPKGRYVRGWAREWN